LRTHSSARPDNLAARQGVPSLATAHTQTVTRAVVPRQLVPFTLQWNPSQAHTTAVARFVHCALAADLPPGWHTQPDHLHHTDPDENSAGPHPSPQHD